MNNVNALISDHLLYELCCYREYLLGVGESLNLSLDHLRSGDRLG